MSINVNNPQRNGAQPPFGGCGCQPLPWHGYSPFSGGDGKHYTTWTQAGPALEQIYSGEVSFQTKYLTDVLTQTGLGAVGEEGDVIFTTSGSLTWTSTVNADTGEESTVITGLLTLAYDFDFGDTHQHGTITWDGTNYVHSGFAFDPPLMGFDNCSKTRTVSGSNPYKYKLVTHPSPSSYVKCWWDEYIPDSDAEPVHKVREVLPSGFPSNGGFCVKADPTDSTPIDIETYTSDVGVSCVNFRFSLVPGFDPNTDAGSGDGWPS